MWNTVRKPVALIVAMVVACSTFFGTPTTYAATKTIYIDLGRSTSTTTTTGWNNVTDPRAGSAQALVYSTGAASTATVQITDSFYYDSSQGVDFSTNINGTTSSSVYPSTATSDSLFLGTLNSVTDTSGALSIAGLNNAYTYDFRFYASRVAGDSGNRTTNYTISGTTVSLNATDNVNSYVDITGKSPTSGAIAITVAKAASATFGYLGVLEITEHIPNVLPTANAGVDQSITLPTSSATLSGSGTDTDGTIASYGWTFVSGPKTPTIVSASSASTSVTGMTLAGEYKFRLTVTDNSGGTGTDDIVVLVNGSSLPGSQQSIAVPINGSGSTENAILSLPNDYSSTTTTYPLLIFLQGAGESGTDLSLIYTSSTAGGPAYYIAQGTFPTSFTNPADSQAYKFIILSPQASGWSTTATQLNYVLNYMASAYRINTNRVYLTGLSAGGESVIGYTAHKDFETSLTVTPAYKPAATVPMSGAISTPAQSTVDTTIADNVNVWGFGSESDTFGVNTHLYITGSYSGNNGPTPPGLGSLGRFTPYSGGHCCWGQFYDPAYKETIGGVSMNMYEWMLKFQRSANNPPTANAGTDQSITLPTTSTTLSGSGSDSDGTIASYAWTTLSGPATPTIVSASSASTSVTNMTVAGTYTFRLTVTDNGGAVAIDDINVVVNSTGSPSPYGGSAWAIPGTIQTENYDLGGQGVAYNDLTAGNSGSAYRTSENVDVESTTDSSGSYDVGWIRDGEWLKYTVSVATTGTYTLQTRVSSPNTGKTIRVEMDGNTVTTVAVPNTGAWTTWQTVTTTGLSLTAGSHVMRLYFTTGSTTDDALGFNLNYTTFSLANTAPTANAGVDQALTLPTSTTTLSGSGTDSDGTIASYAWSFISGPATPSITSASSASTGVTGLSTAGTYTFRLTVTDNLGATGIDDINVVVSTGALQSKFNLSLGVSTVSGWTNVYGNPNASVPTATDSGTGFGFRSTGTANWSGYGGTNAADGIGATSDDGGGFAFPSTVVANAWYNYGDTFTTGKYQTQLFGLDPSKYYNIVLLGSRGTASSGASPRVTDYNIKGLATLTKQTLDNWLNTSHTITFSNVQPDASGYINIAINKKSDLSGGNFGYLNGITVAQVVNASPTANAGTDQSITLPTTTATLSGSGSDSDGTIASYAWSFISGPSTPSITSAASASTGITGLSSSGTYIFRLTVTDNLGATGTDDINVVVNSASNVSPTANAGVDQSIQLPTSTVTLSGSGTDSDGTIASYAWSFISGPATPSITSASSASTGVTGLSTAGTYTFRLTVTDNLGATGIDDIVVTVTAANVAPTANAGTDQTITLPTSSVAFSGSGTDSDGTIASYAWTNTVKPSGAATPTIVSASSASTSVTGLSTAGTYTFRLTVTDNQGATGYDDINVVVNAAVNTPPTANAGTDQSVVMPVSQITLSGSGSDSDGTIASYAWTETSSNYATINSPTSATTTVKDLAAGTYTFRLTVTDNQGATGYDDVIVTVNAQSVGSCPAKTIVVLGSSTSAGYGISPSSDAYVNRFTTYFNALKSGNNVVNLAVGGYTTYHILPTGTTPPGGRPSPDTARNITAALTYNPAAIIVNMPSNDTANGYTTTEQETNFQTVVATAAAAGVPVWITTTQPRNFAQSYIDEQEVVRDWITTTYGAHAIDFWTTFATSGGTIDPTYDQGDGIHLTNIAHKKLYARVAETNLISTICTNQNPTANAGVDQTITLPTSAATLSGSGTDSDGTIASYAWSFISGPSTPSITSSSSASTGVTGLSTAGTYVFQLTVTDDRGGTGIDTMNIVVNTAPTANAGVDQSIQLPTSTVSLSGSGTDSDGIIASYAWSFISGPATPSITSASSASTGVTGLSSVGSYVFRLTVTDNKGATGSDDIAVTVTAANVAPTANAGTDQTITLPTSSTTLSGSGSDSDGTIASYAWTNTVKPSGALTPTIASASTASTGISGLSTAGTYTFRLTVTDNQGATGYDDITVLVNTAPTANAGVDQSITLPTSTTTLSGSGSDSDGSIAAYAWSFIGGPSTPSITSAAAASTGVTGLSSAGTYIFRLTVTDNLGATGTDNINVVVNAPANISPSANAGVDQNIQLPTSSVTLSGSGTDSDGTIASYAWSFISGPSTPSITSASAASTGVTGLSSAGTYTFRLTVTDNQGATGIDDVNVIVAAANVAPTANAGTDQTITLPTTTATLSGVGSDSDGTIASYAWTNTVKPSGAATPTIVSASSASTSVTGLSTAGTYTFRLTVTDNQGATGTGDVNIVVNTAPTANAGVDQNIQLPTSSVTLSGSGTDSDGTIASYAWTNTVKPSGAATPTIVSASSASTSVTGLSSAGTYIFRLTVTDNLGATGSDTINVVVQAANSAPTANAGVDQNIQLPTSSVTLSGSGTDSDGTIASYAWTNTVKPSGAATPTIVSASSASTSVTGLSTAGTYVFHLVVTDNQGATGTDDVTVVVNTATNISPTAAAGTDQLIQEGTTSTTLSGSGSDSDGIVSVYAWSFVSGPATATIVSPSSTDTDVTGLTTPGTYTFRLTVTDNLGATGTDDVVVTVNARPTATAGVDQSITLPISTVNLAGSGTDTDGSIASYAWSVVSGPTTPSFTSATSASTGVTGLSTAGTYVFQLAVTDTGGGTGTDTVSITVNAAVSSGGGGGSSGGGSHSSSSSSGSSSIIPTTTPATVESPVVPVASSTTFRTTASILNVRLLPNGQIITKVPLGTAGIVVADQPDVPGWTKVSFTTGVVGWVSSHYIVLSTAITGGGATTGTSSMGTVRVVVSKLNVRATPAGTVLKTIPFGTTASIVGASNGWTNIQFFDGSTGWVSSQYITSAPRTTGSSTIPPAATVPTTPSASTTSGTPPLTIGTAVTVSVSVLNVRSAPNGSITGKVSSGDNGTTTDSADNWTKVTFEKGVTGWVWTAYIKKGHTAAVSKPTTTSTPSLTPVPAVPAAPVSVPSVAVSWAGKQVVVTAATVTIYTQPGDGDIGVVSKDTVGTVTADTGSLWIVVSFSHGLSGYVERASLSLLP